MRTQTTTPFDDFLTLSDIARRLGESYHTAYALSVSGILGDPVTLGRMQLFPREIAELAIRERLAKRATRKTTGPATGLEA